MDSLSDIALYVTIVDSGSLTAAAGQLGISKSAVSKRLQALEQRLGARLLQRTTRRMSPTEAGVALYSRGRDIVQAAQEAELAVGQLQQAAIGKLRVSAPVSFGQRVLGGIAARFAAANARVELELDFSDRQVDLIEEGFDLAVRIGRLPDSELVARRLAESRQYVVGSPAYLADHGVPQLPADLKSHQCLLYRYQRAGDRWELCTEGQVRAVPVSGRIRSNNGDVLADAACSGAGLAMLPDFIVAAQLRSGRLCSVLDDYCESRRGVYAVYPDRRQLSVKLRLFVDALAQELKNLAW